MSDDWKEQKKRQKAIFTAQQNLPYDVKVRRAELRAREFIQELDRRGMNAHVSVGGLDSIVLLMFLRSRGSMYLQCQYHPWKIKALSKYTSSLE